MTRTTAWPAILLATAALGFRPTPLRTAAGAATAPSAGTADPRVAHQPRDPTGVTRFADDPKVIEPEVDFLSTPPTIDGRLDPALEQLPVRQFNLCQQSSDHWALISPTYRLAYGTEFLYLFLQAQADSLTFRDRAYQNGDGFVLVLGSPKPDDSPTDEFYVLACSAVNDPRLEWSRRVFWYYNVDHLFLPVGRGTQMRFQAAGGTISFELLLRWDDVRPFHPWISDGVGFNLRFTKALGETDRARYLVVLDEPGAEGRPRRYARLKFQSPLPEGGPQTFVTLQQGHVAQGDSLRVITVTAASTRAAESVFTVLRSGEGAGLRSQVIHRSCERGVTRRESALPSGTLPPGGYRLEWSTGAGSSGGEIGLTILPPFDSGSMHRQIDAARGKIADGSCATLLFLGEELQRQLDALKPYEPSADLRTGLIALTDMIGKADQGDDVLARQTGIVRRAFRSKLDHTLQPYCVRLPADFDRGRAYPLMVYLHGSASDETSIKGVPFLTNGGFIEIGPLGRGPSNAFATPQAQTDIAEAIDDVIANYPIDPTRIVLSGFSMGGYGVYRTFYETPKKFKALVILSGGPDMRGYAPEANPPDFLQKKFLAPFRGIPIFVYHGEQDLNVPYAKTVELVKKLKAAGARVEFKTEPGMGHSAPRPATLAEYYSWLESVVGRK